MTCLYKALVGFERDLPVRTWFVEFLSTSDVSASPVEAENHR